MTKDKKQQVMTLRLFIIIQSIISFALGLFFPFYLIFIQNFGNSIESFGFAIGLMALAQAVTAYFAGKYSDRFGRKFFFVISGIAYSILIIAYTLIDSLLQLYILQVILGIVQAIMLTMEVAILGDLTKKKSRGENIGKYQAITGVFAGLAMMGGGYLAGSAGIKVIFYITAILIVISCVVLQLMHESG